MNDDPSDWAKLDRKVADDAKAALGAVSAFVWLATATFLCWPSATAPSVLSFSGLSFIVGGAFAAQFLLGLPFYAIQSLGIRVIFGPLDSKTDESRANIGKMFGWVLFLAQIVVTYFVTNWAYSYFFV